MNKDANEVLLIDNENEKKCWELMHYCVFMHRGMPLILHNSTNAYVTRQGNDHYVYYHIVMMVAISNG